MRSEQGFLIPDDHAGSRSIPGSRGLPAAYKRTAPLGGLPPAAVSADAARSGLWFGIGDEVPVTRRRVMSRRAT